MGKYVMALDAGTTSNKCLIIDKNNKILSIAYKEFKQYFPKPGYVEHDANEIWDTMLEAMKEALQNADIKASDIDCIGITNQRETTIIWDKKTGMPIYNAIVWQCKRTSEYCDLLKKQNLTDKTREKTGLVIDAYFSATKIKWILDNVKGAREKAKNGELLFGTVDTWIIWKLTNGNMHVTDYTNASRTLIYNIKELKWDEELLNIFDIEKSMLPEVRKSSGDFGEVDESFLGAKIKITGVAGDQQSALFGQLCLNKGDVKVTYGTGCFMLMNIGENIVYSKNGLLTTIACTVDEKIIYALEGSIFIGAAAMQWLRDGLKAFTKSAESEKAALSVEDTAGCYVVPAFVGLGAPYWKQDARGTIVGITRGTNINHIIRATLESIAYQVNDILDVMVKDSDIMFNTLRVDGGMSKNDFFMQTQSDLIDKKIIKPKNTEITVLGAAYLAGLATGYWQSIEELKNSIEIEKEFIPDMSEEKRNEKIKGWNRAIKCAIAWADNA